MQSTEVVMPEGNDPRPCAGNAENTDDHSYLKIMCLHYIYCVGVISWLINLALAALILLINLLFSGGKMDVLEFIVWSVVMTWPFILGTRILRAMLLYKYWQMVPPERAAVTPKQAIVPLFIPIFNLYWNFVSIFKLGSFLAEETGDRTPMHRALSYCIWTMFVFWTTIFVLNPAGELMMMLSFYNSVKRWRNWE